MTRSHLAAAVASLLVFATCGEDGTGPGGTDTTPAALSKTAGDNQTGTVGAALASELAVKVSNAGGAALNGVSVAWAVASGGGSVSPASSSTDASGIAKSTWTLGTAAGSNTATATVSGLAPVSFTAAGTADRAASIVLTPDSLRFDALGDSARLQASVADRFGNAVTTTVGWSSSDSTIASIDAQGLVRSRKEGQATVTATADTARRQARVTVTQTIASITVSPERDTINAIGYTRQLTAALLDRNGHAIAGSATRPTWASLDTATVSVDTTGKVSARAKGDARVEASAASKADTALIHVRQIVASVSVSPATKSLLVGDTTRLSAAAADSNSQAITDARFTWTSSNASVAEVDTTGKVTGKARGSADISAETSGKSAKAAISVQGFVLVDSVVVGGSGGFFGGAVSSDFSLIAIGPFTQDASSSPLLRFYNASGQLLATHNVLAGGGGGTRAGTWAVAMTRDGSKTVVGSDDENLYIFSGTSLAASGRPIPGNFQIRGVAISDNGRWAGAGGGRFTLHDLTAADPIAPVFVDSATDQLRAVDFSSNNRYVAYGGQRGQDTGNAATLMGIYDLERRQRVFHDSIPCGCNNAELRMLSISSDGNRIVAGDWADRLHYYVRADTTGTWQRVQTITIGSRVYWTDMSADNSVAIVATQSNGLRLYSLGATSLALLWTRGEPNTPAIEPPMDGGQRTVSITPDGRHIAAGTRGGGGGGGQLYVFDRTGRVVLSWRTYAVLSGGIWLAANGADPEVWFNRTSDDGTKAVFASWSGIAYFFRVE
ncbi:MAG: Ig-like domain-containing protein [Gemmatimonadetes bacterium]|nr:Ig-like domain-containing protein [Gemmatimonadota bacterium]